MKNFLFWTVMLLLPSWAFAEDVLNVVIPITYVEGISPPERVKQECSVERSLESSLEMNLSKTGAVNLSRAAASGKQLRVQILGIQAVGGGAWTGAKSLAVHVELWQDGTLLRKSNFSRSSNGGIAAGLLGTCAMLDRCSDALGRDVAKWVSNPRYAAQDVIQGTSSGESATSTSDPSVSAATK